MTQHSCLVSYQKRWHLPFPKFLGKGVFMSKATMVAVATLLGVCTAHAADPMLRCQQLKLKAHGKLKNCLSMSAAGVLSGRDDKSASCQAKFSAALQNADYVAVSGGTSCRYIDNGDGSVSDLNTGLVWEKTDDLGGIHDKDNLYTWSKPYLGGGGPEPDGDVFTTFLYGLNGGTSSDGMSTSGCFAGHCDWRLPTIEELRGIRSSPCSTSPCIDPAFGPTSDLPYWSITTTVDNPNYAWTWVFDVGYVLNAVKPLSICARAVRGGL